MRGNHTSKGPCFNKQLSKGLDSHRFKVKLLSLMRISLITLSSAKGVRLRIPINTKISTSCHSTNVHVSFFSLTL